MANQKYTSPWAFAYEIDRTYQPIAASIIPPTVVGKCKYGPAFWPWKTSNYKEYSAIFGAADPNFKEGWSAYATRQWHKHRQSCSTIRILGDNGLKDDAGTAIAPGFTTRPFDICSGSATKTTMAIFHLSGTSMFVTASGIANSNQVAITVTGSSGVVQSATCSFVTGTYNYVKNIFNTDPTQCWKYGYYVNKVFSYEKTNIQPDGGTWSTQTYTNANNGDDFHLGYNSSSTPWIISQDISNKEYRLFRFHTIPHGSEMHKQYKIQVKNVKPSISTTATKYGTFDVVLRDFDDTDMNPFVLETFNSLDLDPASPNYIAKRIGDYYLKYDNSTNVEKLIEYGDYKNTDGTPKSARFRVETVPEGDLSGSYPNEALPWGWEGYGKEDHRIPTLLMQNALKDKRGVYSSKICWGLGEGSFRSGSIDDRMKQLPAITTTYYDNKFSLKFVTCSSGLWSASKLLYNSASMNGEPTAQNWSYPTTLQTTSSNGQGLLGSTEAQFVVCFQNGFDGWDAYLSNPLDNEGELTATSQLAVKSFYQAFDILGDETQLDTNIAIVPGIYATKITDYMLEKAQDRADLLYIMDITGSTSNDAIDQLSGRDIDNSYGCCYYPKVKHWDSENGKTVNLPASIGLFEAIAFTDQNTKPWFVPAGLTRGALSDATGVVDNLKVKERNRLYENRINPIIKFSNVGVVTWGNKTLQAKQSYLSSIHIRRLLIHLRKSIATAALNLVFEPNVVTTWENFVNRAEPFLQDAQQNFGLVWYKIRLDSTTTTQTEIDQNKILAKIAVQPATAAEIIEIPFTITNNGVLFDEF